MHDLISRKQSLSSFSGIAFVGGFSNADVLDSAKGWAAGIKFNEHLLQVFENMRMVDLPFTGVQGIL